MKSIVSFIITICLFSCGNERVLHLPEIPHSNISEIHDVSAGYLFYDETQTDSIELNRKNLIVSTNWLINVDKRLTLEQAIPKIKFLQEKKNSSSHKNKNARNYYTCNDISKKNLGFIDFTEIVYTEKDAIPFSKKQTYIIKFRSSDSVTITQNTTGHVITTSNKNNLLRHLKKLDTTTHTLILGFYEKLHFQDYISYKALLLDGSFKKLVISKKEFLYN